MKIDILQHIGFLYNCVYDFILIASRGVRAKIVRNAKDVFGGLIWASGLKT